MTYRQKTAAIIRLHRKLKRTVSRMHTIDPKNVNMHAALAMRALSIAINIKRVRATPTFKTGGIIPMRTTAEICGDEIILNHPKQK